MKIKIACGKLKKFEISFSKTLSFCTASHFLRNRKGLPNSEITLLRYLFKGIWLSFILKFEVCFKIQDLKYHFSTKKKKPKLFHCIIFLNLIVPNNDFIYLPLLPFDIDIQYTIFTYQDFLFLPGYQSSQFFANPFPLFYPLSVDFIYRLWGLKQIKRPETLIKVW